MFANRKMKDTADVIRPPGALSFVEFADRCTGCGDCEAVCPAELIFIGPGGLPQLRSVQGCGHCGLCADVCTHGAILFTARMQDGLKRVLAEEKAGSFAI